jgi:ribosomal protein S27E
MAEYQLSKKPSGWYAKCLDCRTPPVAFSDPKMVGLENLIGNHERLVHEPLKVIIEHSGDPGTSFHVVCQYCGADWLVPDDDHVRDAITFHPVPCRAKL